MAEQKKEKLTEKPDSIRTAKDARAEELTEKEMEKLSGGIGPAIQGFIRGHMCHNNTRS